MLITEISQQIEFCVEHHTKKIEVFCEDCLELLCIDCILTQKHKSHEIVSLEAGSGNQKVLIEEQSEITMS
jgi:hypothetical protein